MSNTDYERVITQLQNAGIAYEVAHAEGGGLLVLIADGTYGGLEQVRVLRFERYTLLGDFAHVLYFISDHEE